MGLAEDIYAIGSQAPAVASQLVSVIRAVGPVLPTIKLVVDDPAFPRVIAQIRELHEIEASKPSAPSVPGVPKPRPDPRAGIGLKKAVPILDAIIYARKNPWAPWVFGAAFLLAVGGIGYRMGKRAQR